MERIVYTNPLLRAVALVVFPLYACQKLFLDVVRELESDGVVVVGGTLTNVTSIGPG